MQHRPSSHSGAPLAASLLILAGGVLAAGILSRKPRHRHRDEDAPARSLREQRGSTRLVGRAVTIAKPREEVYRAWRDFSRFPDFMENVVSVEILDQERSRWSVEGPHGMTADFVSRITEDVPGERISWASEDDASVPNSGRISFRDAPGGRGTVVDLDIGYDPPGGAIGAVVAKLFQREPKIQARRDLKRFKQLMETGEIATSDMRPEAGGRRS
jgi:uncharacterized membrane protein